MIKNNTLINLQIIIQIVQLETVKMVGEFMFMQAEPNIKELGEMVKEQEEGLILGLTEINT